MSAWVSDAVLRSISGYSTKISELGTSNLPMIRGSGRIKRHPTILAIVIVLG